MKNEIENEYANVTRYPRMPLIAEGLAYPEPVQKLIAEMEEKFEAWAVADSELASALEDMEDAKALDAKLFKDSVLAGSKDPGEVHTPKAARLVERNRILANERLLETNRAAGALSQAIETHAKEIVMAAISMARNGLAENERLVMEASRLVIEAGEVREKSLIGLSQASELTRGTYQFDPSFPRQGNVVMPDIREFRANEICDNLEKLVDRGILFPAE